MFLASRFNTMKVPLTSPGPSWISSPASGVGLTSAALRCSGQLFLGRRGSTVRWHFLQPGDRSTHTSLAATLLILNLLSHYCDGGDHHAYLASRRGCYIKVLEDRHRAWHLRSIQYKYLSNERMSATFHYILAVNKVTIIIERTGLMTFP